MPYLKKTSSFNTIPTNIVSFYWYIKKDIYTLKKSGLLFNLLCSALVILLPLALYTETGKLEYSFSAYYNTSAFYILTCGLLLVAFSFLVSENITSGLLLIGVALFDTYEYTIVHNLFASLFFLHTTYHIINDKRYGILGVPIIISAFFIPYITLFWFEVIAVICLGIHGVLYSLKKLKLIEKRRILKQW